MIIAALVLAVIVGYIRGGTLKKIIRLNFPYFFLVIIALIIQLNINILMKIVDFGFLAYLLLLVSYLLLIGAVWFNRKNEFLFLVLIGLLLNFLVIALNSGMPVSYGAAKILGFESGDYLNRLAVDYKHIAMLSTTKLRYFAAIIPLSKPFPLPGIYSVGDVFISIGTFLFVQNYITYSGKHRKEGKRSKTDVGHWMLDI
ncbi:MAG: hypothetical protein E3J54_01580 [Actinobacteria bacterium]|nr:MAG: hypothetical protein E3J54_01580 [Actinomycetota bacterium]